MKMPQPHTDPALWKYLFFVYHVSGVSTDIFIYKFTYTQNYHSCDTDMGHINLIAFSAPSFQYNMLLFCSSKHVIYHVQPALFGPGLFKLFHFQTQYCDGYLPPLACVHLFLLIWIADDRNQQNYSELFGMRTAKPNFHDRVLVKFHVALLSTWHMLTAKNISNCARLL